MPEYKKICDILLVMTNMHTYYKKSTEKQKLILSTFIYSGAYCEPKNIH